MIRNSQTRYGSVAKFFHWLVFLLVAVMLFAGFYMQTITDKMERSTVINLHKVTGITILGLMVLRALWALTNPKPLLPADMPNWQKRAAHWSHLGLYVLLIAMPIFGWVGAVAAGHVPHFLYWDLNLPISENKTLADVCFTAHNVTAFLIIGLVSVHILAAFYHLVIRKDEIMLRMMPGDR